jgi:hypothetical protein
VAPDGSVGPSAAPEPLAGRTAFLSARRPSTSEPEHRFAQGGSMLTSGGQMAGLIDSQIASFQPSKSSGRLPDRPFEGTSTHTVAGRQVTRSTRYALTGAFDRDTVSLAIHLTERYAIPGPTPDSPPLDVSDTGDVTIVIDTCPDEDGSVVASTTAQGSLDVTGPGLARRIVFTGSDRAVAMIDGEANVASRQHAVDADRQVIDASAAEPSVSSHIGATLSWASDASGDSRSDAAVDVRTDEGATPGDVSSWLFGGALTGALADAAIEAAQRVWRDGRCLELKADPAGRQVDSGSETTITVTIHHKAFDEEVERDVEATLEGTEEVDPLDSPVRAPADFTYTATDEQEGEGTITFRSVSNRGIAEELSETYVVASRWLLDVNGRMRLDFVNGGTANLTIRGRGLPVRFESGDAPGVTVSGSIRIRGRIVMPLPLNRRCTGSYRESLDVDARLNGSAQLRGEGEDRRLIVQLRPPDGDTVVRTDMDCPGLSMEHAAPGGDFLWQWSSTIGPTELPLEEGSVRVRGRLEHRTASGSITLRKED